MKVEKTRQFCVNWIEYGMMYFRWYKTEGGALAFAESLKADGYEDVAVWKK